MKRKIVKIDSEKCNGCGICVDACHEGAIALIDGKAVLISDSYCDGLGDCLPECPVGAIEIVERQAAPYDKEAVDARMGEIKSSYGGCPSLMNKTISTGSPVHQGENTSQLGNWPVQIKLAAPNAPYFNGCHLLIAADCTAFAYGNFHSEMMPGRVCLIGCPKLDSVDYSEKLGQILMLNDIKSVTVVRMEVPCCGGITAAVESAIENAGKLVPWSVRTISIEGEII